MGLFTLNEEEMKKVGKLVHLKTEPDAFDIYIEPVYLEPPYLKDGELIFGIEGYGRFRLHVEDGRESPES